MGDVIRDHTNALCKLPVPRLCSGHHPPWHLNARKQFLHEYFVHGIHAYINTYTHIYDLFNVDNEHT